MKNTKVGMLSLRHAIETSWNPETAYQHVEEKGNPALGQCYVTSRVIQHYFPDAELVEGEVQTSHGIEKHFWNVFKTNGQELHFDLTWQQFPPGSTVKTWKIRDRKTLDNNQDSVDRLDRLLSRVKQHLGRS